MSVKKRFKCNAHVSIIIACKIMHDFIIDKTCIDRTIEHYTDCFHLEPIIESPVCEMSSLKRTGIGDKS